jgi:hypothetical protein
MTSLNVNVTTKQYSLQWSGVFPKYNYSSNNLGALFQSEKEMNDYLEQKVSDGWIVLQTNVKEFN